jgi:putative SOS response-associated peptidase YedK
MCGRFTLALDADGLQQAFPGFTLPPRVAPRYNIAPTQPVLAVPNNDKNQIEYMVWGLIPGWAKDTKIGNQMINARAETLGEKPSFKNAYKRRRCLILADGFYEWKKEGSGKTPMFVHLKDREPFALAGLWEIWHPGDESIVSCTIITTEPNELMATLHNRMPVILPQSAWNEWLDPAERQPHTLNELLTPYPADQMQAYAVSPMVNSPANDAPECLLPV